MSEESHHPVLGYATPAPLAAEGEVYREGAWLVVRTGATLPRVCVLCGEEGAGEPVRLTYTWDASFTMQKRGAGAAEADKPRLQLRDKGDVHTYLCARHRGRYGRGRVWGSAAMGLAAAMMIAGLVIGVISESSVNPARAPLGISLLVAGFALLIVALFYFTLASRTLSCVRIEAGYLRLEGASEEFLRRIGEARK